MSYEAPQHVTSSILLLLILSPHSPILNHPQRDGQVKLCYLPTKSGIFYGTTSQHKAIKKNGR
jgi:hypothetical protein